MFPDLHSMARSQECFSTEKYNNIPCLHYKITPVSESHAKTMAITSNVNASHATSHVFDRGLRHI